MTEFVPESLARDHVLEDFDCGDEYLNTWLKKRARNNEGKYARSFVVCDDDRRVFGFYCLSAGSVSREDVSKSLRRNAPELIPVTILGRFGVDVRHQNRGIGGKLLRDAFLRTLGASRMVGSRVILVQAKTDRVRDYYSRFGFLSMPEHPLTLVLPMETIAATLEQ